MNRKTSKFKSILKISIRIHAYAQMDVDERFMWDCGKPMNNNKIRKCRLHVQRALKMLCIHVAMTRIYLFSIILLCKFI